jgi:hypothetical protein
VGRLIAQIQGVGSLRDRILNENKMRHISNGEIANSRKGGIATRAALGIARNRAGAVVDDPIPVCERLDGFIGDGGGIWRALNQGPGIFSECSERDRNPARIGILRGLNSYDLLGERTG